MGAGHCDYLGLLTDDVVSSLFLIAQDLKGPALLDFLKQLVNAMLLEFSFLVGLMSLLV